jgi:hypothetical protein
MCEMRKRFITREARASEHQWLDSKTVGQVEITSEDAGHPIESALTGVGPGWRASSRGEQVIRLLFDEPLRLGHIWLRFDEESDARTQEFVLRWSSDQGRSYHEVLRQQFTFSPPGTTREIEDYAVDLNQVTALELRIIPDIGGGTAQASLKELRLA